LERKRYLSGDYVWAGHDLNGWVAIWQFNAHEIIMDLASIPELTNAL
jgi:hypothetical protein